MAKTKETNIGGQAVIEGVMFKSEDKVAIAVRNPDKKIIVKEEKFNSVTKNKILGLPFIRGIIILVETMILGMKALNYSANVNIGEEEELGFWSVLLTFVLSIGLALFFVEDK